jgi:hypothetical protein
MCTHLLFVCACLVCFLFHHLLSKNSLDHLYWEWRGRPTALLTFGGHGGGKCAEALRTVCAGGLKMTLLPPELDVKVTLPHDHIQGDVRVAAARFNDGPAAASAAQPAAGGRESSEAQPYFLAQYDSALEAMLTELLAVMERPPPPPEPRKTDKA